MIKHNLSLKGEQNKDLPTWPTSTLPSCSSAMLTKTELESGLRSKLLLVVTRCEV